MALWYVEMNYLRLLSLSCMRGTGTVTPPPYLRIRTIIIYLNTSMAQCKTAVSPVSLQWGYCNLVLSHRCSRTRIRILDIIISVDIFKNYILHPYIVKKTFYRIRVYLIILVYVKNFDFDLLHPYLLTRTWVILHIFFQILRNLCATKSVYKYMYS